MIVVRERGTKKKLKPSRQKKSFLAISRFFFSGGGVIKNAQENHHIGMSLNAFGRGNNNNKSEESGGGDRGVDLEEDSKSKTYTQ